MYLVMVKIMIEVIIIVVIRYIVIIDNFFFWVVCLFVFLLLVFFKVIVVLDDDIFVGKYEVVVEVVDVLKWFEEVLLCCFVVVIGVFNLELIVDFEFEYIVCVFEDVFLMEVV